MIKTDIHEMLRVILLETRMTLEAIDRSATLLAAVIPSLPFVMLIKTGKNQQAVITVQPSNRLVKTWCRDINLKGNYRSYT